MSSPSETSSHSWRIGNKIWEDLDRICTKLNMKKSYRCTDKIIESAIKLIDSNLDIIDLNFKESIIGLTYLINSNFFNDLIIFLMKNNDKIMIKLLSDKIISYINSSLGELDIIVESESEKCKSLKRILGSIIISLSSLFGSELKLRVLGREEDIRSIEIFSPTNNVTLLSYLNDMIQRFSENYVDI
ncbi:hypothetical protein DJ521_07925, partial [Sulfolobus sp. E3]